MTNTWHERFSTEECIHGKEPMQFVVEAAATFAERESTLHCGRRRTEFRLLGVGWLRE